jgi:hypothetical protein
VQRNRNNYLILGGEDPVSLRTAICNEYFPLVSTAEFRLKVRSTKNGNKGRRTRAVGRGKRPWLKYAFIGWLDRGKV